VYMTEMPKRIRNKAIFRDDNASLSQGQDKRWYFYFSLDEDQLEQLPEKLVRQASAIAQKVRESLTPSPSPARPSGTLSPERKGEGSAMIVVVKK